MNCKQCNAPLKKPTQTFCSVPCKSEYKRSLPKQVFDETKQYRCKIDGIRFSLGAKQSGYLKKYSKNTLLKEFDESDWEIVDAEIDTNTYWNCPHCTEKYKVTDRDHGGWIAGHLLKIHNITKVQHIDQFPDDAYLWPYRLERERTKEAITEDSHFGVQCLECGEWFENITNTHLLNKHKMTVGQYRTKYPTANIWSQELINVAKGI